MTTIHRSPGRPFPPPARRWRCRRGLLCLCLLLGLAEATGRAQTPPSRLPLIPVPGPQPDGLPLFRTTTDCTAPQPGVKQAQLRLPGSDQNPVRISEDRLAAPARNAAIPAWQQAPPPDWPAASAEGRLYPVQQPPPEGGQPPRVPAPPAEAVPAPRPLPELGTAPGVRLQRLGQPGVVGGTPQPNEETIREYRQFVRQIVDPQNTFDLVVNRSRLMLLTERPRLVQITDPKVADFTFPLQNATPPDPKVLSLTGRSVGTTILNLWFKDPDDPKKDKILSYLVRVFPDPEAKERLENIYKALADEINHAFPDSHVSLFLLGDKLAVCGQARDAVEAVQILRAVRSNAPGETQRAPVDVANLNVNVLAPVGGEENPDALVAPTLQNLFLAAGPNIINLLKIPGEQQVMLKVLVAEVNRSAARSIGVNFTVSNRRGLTVFSQLTGGLLGSGSSAGSTGSAGGSSATGASGVNLPLLLDNGQINVAINALRTLNLARSLAEPNLVALNGRPANFQAGGQFPVPIVTGFTAAGLQGVQFVPFGVQLSFVPVITERDRIRLAIQANVSTRDLSTTAVVNGTSVPGLNTRNFSTQVDMKKGETLAVAGLIQTNLSGLSTRVPLFGDLPLLGRFFSVNSASSADQELIILVTPDLVHPLAPGECLPLPGSDLVEPDDVEFYLLGRMESRHQEDYRSAYRTDTAKMVRYAFCEDILISGPHGHTGDGPAGPVVPPSHSH